VRWLIRLFGRFNVIDIKELHSRTELPAIVVMRTAPDMGRIRDALRNLPDFGKRWQAIRDAGTITEVDMPEGSLCIQCAGISTEDVAKIVRLSTTPIHIPEPLRVAHLIATGMVCGGSRGRHKPHPLSVLATHRGVSVSTILITCDAGYDKDDNSGFGMHLVDNSIISDPNPAIPN